MLVAIIGGIILLGGLIFFHELGHFSVAKLFGVRVEVFALGFGKKLLRRTIGETEYCLCLFPLGGYVKLMGDDPFKEVPAVEAHRAFSTQKLYKRFLIVAAGPIANLFLAFFLFMIVFWFGQPMAASQVGNVLVDSPAWTAGFRPLDHVLDINGEKVQSWREMQNRLKPRSGEKAQVRVKRDTEELLIPIGITTIEAKNVYGEDVMVGGIDGISLLPLAAKIGISNPNSAAYKAGLRSGDLVTKVDSSPVGLFEDLKQALETRWSPAAPVTVTVKRVDAQTDKKASVEKSFTLVFPKTVGAKARTSPFGRTIALGIYPSELFVEKVNPESPAEKGGMKAGDRIVSLGTKPVYNFSSIVSYVQSQGKSNKAALFTVEREGKLVPLNLVPTQTAQEDPLTREMIHKYLVGFVPMTGFHEPLMTKYTVRSFGPLVVRSFDETITIAERMVVSIGKLVMGQISVKNLGGPVLIATVAGKSLNAGIIPFLQMMALISINLFLLNLFPIPILDGGHLLFFTIEAIQRKPVSIRTMEIANQMGMVFILLLVGLTLFNDISRMVLH